MELKVSSLAERPEMYRPVVEMPDTWPELMQHDFTGNAHYDRIATELPEYVLFAEDERGEVVAHAYAVPFALGRRGGELPARGWDQVLVWAFQDLRAGTRPDTVSAISVEVPGALAPVRCDLEHGYGVYVEPNVWMRHTL